MEENLGLSSCEINLIVLNGQYPNTLIFIEIAILGKIILFDQQLDDELRILNNPKPPESKKNQR